MERYLAWVVHDGEQVHLGVGGYAARFAPGGPLVSKVFFSNGSFPDPSPETRLLLGMPPVTTAS